MTATLFPLGTYTIGTADYSAGAARTAGAYCLVRKRYGNNQAIYNYAAFEGMSLTDFQAICINPDAATTWLPYPYSAYDWQLLVVPLAQPLTPSTAAGGATITGGGTDVMPVVNAVAASNVILGNMLAGQNAPGSRASETTLTKVVTALAGTLNVTAQGAFFQPVQPVSGPVTDGQLRAAPLPVALPATAATAQGQADATTQLLAIKALLAVPALAAGASTEATQLAIKALLAAPLNVAGTFWPTTQPVTGTFWQAVQPVVLSAIPLATNATTAAGQATGNGLLADVKGLLGQPLTFALPPGAATATAQADQLTKMEAVRLLLAGTLAVGLPAGAATAAKQDAAAALAGTANTALAAIQASVAAGATAAGQTALASKQDAANGYLATLAAGGQPANAFSLVTLQGSNATLVHAGPTWLLGGSVANTATAYRYLFLYNLAAVPSGGILPTTAAGGLVRTIAVPPNVSVQLNLAAGRYTAFPLGLVIAAAAGSTLSTVTSAAAGLTAGVGLTAGDLVVNLDWA